MSTTKGPDLVSGIITNWIPFTTPGPPSIEECSSAVYFQPAPQGASKTLVAFDPYYGHWIDPANKCLAKEHSQWWLQHSDGVTTDINLGPFNCPTGYTTATASPMNSLTTVIGCCPSNYQFQGEILPPVSLGQCLSPLSVGQIITAKSATDDFTWLAVTTTVDSPVNMIGIQINGFVFNDAADLSSPASTIATTTLQITTPTTSSVFPANTNSSSPSKSSLPPSSSLASSFSISTNPAPAVTFSSSKETPSKDSSLGNSAKIGIGIGVSLTIIGISCLIATFVLLRRRTRRSAETGNQEIFEAPGVTTHRDGNDGSKIGVSFVEAPGDMFVEKRLPPVEMWVEPNKGG